MTVNLNVQADVIDITTDTPKPDDILLVDTNVWLWETYGNATINPRTLNTKPNVEEKKRKYSSYLGLALPNGTKLKYCGLILAELAHVIEKTEYEIFKRRNQLNSLKIKQYRHNHPQEHQYVWAIIQLAWSQVTSLASSVDITVDATLANIALHRFRTQSLDGYDLFLIEAISRSEVNNIQVLTDDMDYACVPGIQLFTRNDQVLQKAANQGKLIVR